MKLNKEQQQMVLDNYNLVRHIVHKKGITSNMSEYDDIVSIGSIGLMKAAITFNKEKGIKFSSYAYRCILNEINMHYRYDNKFSNDYSLDAIIGSDKDGNSYTFADIIEDPNSNFIERIMFEFEFIQLISYILNYLNPNQKQVMLYRISGKKQEKISKIMLFSRSYISRLETKAFEKIKSVYENEKDENEVFSISIVDENYIIKFDSNYINGFNLIFSDFLQSILESDSNLDFRLQCTKHFIVIQLPGCAESFDFLARLVKEIDDYIMK